MFNRTVIITGSVPLGQARQAGLQPLVKGLNVSTIAEHRREGV